MQIDTTPDRAPRAIGLGPVITNRADLTEDSPDGTVISIDVAAELTGHTVASLRRFRELKKGPESFVLNHAIRYRLGNIRDYLETIYAATKVGGKTA